MSSIIGTAIGATQTSASMRALRILSQLTDDQLAALDAATGAFPLQMREAIKTYRISAGPGLVIGRLIFDAPQMNDTDFRILCSARVLASRIMDRLSKDVLIAVCQQSEDIADVYRAGDEQSYTMGAQRKLFPTLAGIAEAMTGAALYKTEGWFGITSNWLEKLKTDRALTYYEAVGFQFASALAAELCVPFGTAWSMCGAAIATMGDPQPWVFQLNQDMFIVNAATTRFFFALAKQAQNAAIYDEAADVWSDLAKPGARAALRRAYETGGPVSATMADYATEPFDYREEGETGVALTEEGGILSLASKGIKAYKAYAKARKQAKKMKKDKQKSKKKLEAAAAKQDEAVAEAVADQLVDKRIAASPNADVVRHYIGGPAQGLGFGVADPESVVGTNEYTNSDGSPIEEEYTAE